MRPNLSPELGKRLALSMVVAATGSAALRGVSPAESAPTPTPTSHGAELPTLDDQINVSSGSMELMSFDSITANESRDPWSDYGKKIYGAAREQWNGIAIISSPPAGPEKFLSLSSSPPLHGRTNIEGPAFTDGDNKEWVFANAPVAMVHGKPFLMLINPADGQPTFADIMKFKKEGYLHLFEFRHSKPRAVPLNAEDGHILDGRHGDLSTLVKILNIQYGYLGGIRPSKVIPHP